MVVTITFVVLDVIYNVMIINMITITTTQDKTKHLFYKKKYIYNLKLTLKLVRKNGKEYIHITSWKE